MIDVNLEEQLHGYRNGHQLLSSSTHLPREDQDLIDRLSDLSGPLRPGEIFEPYLTTYPLPSGGYYVFARTWQDLGASRAGCVLTRSLLIPMAAWDSIKTIAPLLTDLKEIGPNEKGQSRPFPTLDVGLPKSDDPKVVELVEAIFLEERQPIVVFEMAKSETIALRLLTAFWPSFRRSFSLCTFALGPRKIYGREFDLVFAPKLARARFSDWKGRRIDTSDTTKPRHRWSALTAEHIFRSIHPSLTAQDTAGFLRKDSQGNESALRLSLLWNELVEKASSTPSAVLGLLDILSSQRETSKEDYFHIFPQLRIALEMVTNTFSTEQAWLFLRTLVGKFPDQHIPDPILRKVIDSSRALASRDMNGALNFLEEESKESRTTHTSLVSGLAEGLCSNPSFPPPRVKQLDPSVMARLFAAAPLLSRSLVRAAKLDSDYWMAWLRVAILKSENDVRRRICTAVISEFDDAIFAPLLEPLLVGATGIELTDVAISIGHNSRFKIAAFDEPFNDAVRDLDSINTLRSSVLTKFDFADADRFLVSTMHADITDIGWICAQAPAPRSVRLLTLLLNGVSDRAFVAIHRDQNIRKQVVDTLLLDVATGTPQIVRLLSLGEFPIGEYLQIGDKLLAHLDQESRERFAENLLGRALSEAPLGDQRVSSWVREFSTFLHAPDLIRWATAETAPQPRVSENLVILDSASISVRQSVANSIDELTDRLVHRTWKHLSKEACTAWANLIEIAPNDDLRFRAASPSLAFAFRQLNLPVSPLIVVSFPIVYANLLRSKEGDERSIPAFFALPLSFFVDWDRANSARRELADNFIDSTWPPADLALTAMKAGIENETFDRLSHTSAGRNYIRAIEEDTKRLDASARKRIFLHLRKFTS